MFWHRTNWIKHEWHLWFSGSPRSRPGHRLCFFLFVSVLLRRLLGWYFWKGPVLYMSWYEIILSKLRPKNAAFSTAWLGTPWSVRPSVVPYESFIVQKVFRRNVTSLCPRISLKILHFGTWCASELERNQDCIRVQYTFNRHFASRCVELKLFTELYNRTTAGVRISQSPWRLVLFFFCDCAYFFSI